MLNTCLTVKANQAGSHSNKGWETFTDKVVDVVDKYGGASLSDRNGAKIGIGRGIVFLAWGAWAAKRVTKLNKVSENTTVFPGILLFGADETSHFNQRRELLSPYLSVSCVAYICGLMISTLLRSVQTKDFLGMDTSRRRMTGWNRNTVRRGKWTGAI